MDVVSPFDNEHLEWPQHILYGLDERFDRLIVKSQFIFLYFHPVDVAGVVEPNQLGRLFNGQQHLHHLLCLKRVLDHILQVLEVYLLHVHVIKVLITGNHT